MVLESIFNPFSVKRYPWQMFMAGCLYSFVSFILSYIVFREISGILMVFLIVMASIPIVYVTIKNEEELDLKYDKEIFLLKEHTKVLLYLIFLFLGILFTFVAIYVLSPADVVNNVFKLQHKAIENVNNDMQSQVIGNMVRFNRILLNNFKVLFFCLVFSLLYGTGAIFILTWNASVIATAMGSLIKEELVKGAALVGLGSLSHYFGAATFSFFRYMTHGIFEISAYFLVGLSGGIVSIALIKHNLNNHRVLIDALDLFLISIGLLITAALVEVYITPFIFA